MTIKKQWANCSIGKPNICLSNHARCTKLHRTTGSEYNEQKDIKILPAISLCDRLTFPSLRFLLRRLSLFFRVLILLPLPLLPFPLPLRLVLSFSLHVLR